jgi:hypothetical protein
VSLILEALKKLERDRHSHERGFLVLAAPTDAAAGRAWAKPAAMAAAAAIGAAALTAMLLRSGPPRDPASPEAVAAVSTGDRPHAPAATLAAAVDPALVVPGSAPPTRVAWPAGATKTPARGAPSAAPAGAATASAPRGEEPAAGSAPTEAEPASEPEPEPEPEDETTQAAASGTVSGPTAPLRLEAISARDGAPVAVVSGQMVRVGDRIGQSTVVRIGAAEIEIETDGVRRVLRF